ncbi:SLC13 family permease [Clostridiales bacterium COT073_COT-073]|nr:SLC13 family permease [Clostridiales bacterium COT073_COT-073]
MNVKKIISLLAGLLVAAIIMFIPLNNINPAAQTCLALSLMTVVWWATNLAQSGFISGIYLVCLIIFGVAAPDLVLKAWYGSSTMWLVIGAYMIAGAVKDSGLGERLAYAFIKKFVRSYNGIIISIFALTLILSLLIPHPWPRAFLIMSVMAVVIKSAAIPKTDASKIGFTVFAASVPVSLIFLTGDSVINPLAASYAGAGMADSWLGWFKYMGIPAMISAIITLVLILILFKPSRPVIINLQEISAKQSALGPMTTIEKRTLIWIILAIILWLTDSIHGINIGWVTFGIAMCMSLPLVGEVLTVKSWSQVPVHVLVFLTAAIAIGTVGGATGMNAWIAKTVLPESLPGNLIILALLISLIAVLIHMLMGSVIAVMGVLIPSLLIFTENMAIAPLFVSFTVYLAIASHYILPFHHLNMLVGQGEENGMYTSKETIRLGIPLTAAVFIQILIAVIWWKSLGVI